METTTQHPAGEPPAARPLITVVDDDSSQLASFKNLFQAVACDIRAFASAGVALEYLQDHTPDLILSDLQMPVMTGREFLQNAAMVCPTASRIILGNDADRGTMLDTVEKGIAEKFVIKPVEQDDLKRLVEETLYVRMVLRQQHMHDLLRKISTLPSPPGSVESLQFALRKKERSVKDIAAIVERNPVLVARILRISNSVFFAARQPITDLVQAIAFIGTSYVEGLILTQNTFRHLAGDHDARFNDILEQIWRHSVNRALIGRDIASHWPGSPNPQAAYVACLLLDIGYLVRIQLEPQKYLQLIQLSESTHRLTDELEGKVFDVKHAELGEYLLRLWNFPSAITTAVRTHHDEYVSDPLAQIVQIANVVEAGENSIPHDPNLNGQIREWTRVYMERTVDLPHSAN